MEVVLVDGFGIELSIKAMRLYLERSGVKGWLYECLEGVNDDDACVYERIDADYAFEWGEPLYRVVDRDLGKHASWDDICSHEVKSPIKPFSRTDEILIRILRELGQDAPGHCQLYIADIPDGIEWHIETGSDDFRECAVEGSYHYPQHWYGEPI